MSFVTIHTAKSTLSQLLARVEAGEEIATIRYGITKFSVTMQAVRARWKKRIPPGGLHLTLEQMQPLAFAAPHKKLARLLG